MSNCDPFQKLCVAKPSVFYFSLFSIVAPSPLFNCCVKCVERNSYLLSWPEAQRVRGYFW